jgi:aspartyl-tRNA(Asn)/glutamyl-tRNA(Gln) amidotransferase subunit A
MSFVNLTIEKTLLGLKNKEFSAKEITKHFLDKISKNKDLNAYITVTKDLALKQAEESDKKYKNGENRALEGVPFSIKDLFCTLDVRTTAGSKMLENFVPKYESKVTSQLFSKGVVMLGKTNLDEFAMGSANITSYFGAVKNPLDKELVPGGSSGGSAASVAGDLCVASLGTDTGGSIRQPAAFTGTVGIKPTYGRCSRWGIVAFASSLDQAGPITKTVADSAITLQAISGFDENDATSSNLPVPNYYENFKKALQGNLKGKKIGIPKEYRVDGTPKEILKIWEEGANALKKAGAEIIEVSLPHTKYALPTYYVLAPAEASSNLARYDGVRYGYRAKGEFDSINELYDRTRGGGFGKEVKRRILIGTFVLSHGYYDAYYNKAKLARKAIENDFVEAFHKVDAILTPTTPSPAFKIGEKQDDPLKMYLNDIFTVTANLANLPAIALPFGKSSNNLPLSLQLIGKKFDEQSILNIAGFLERENQ